jgi:rubrerythrin
LIDSQTTTKTTTTAKQKHYQMTTPQRGRTLPLLLTLCVFSLLLTPLFAVTTRTIVAKEQARQKTLSDVRLDAHDRLLQMAEQNRVNADDVLDLLDSLRKAADDELNAVQARWDSDQQQNSQLISNLQTSLSNQKAVCQTKKNAMADLLQQNATSHNRILWLQNRIDKINKLLLDLADQRCENNQIFIARIKENRETLLALRTFKNIYDSMVNKPGGATGTAASSALLEQLMELHGVSDEQRVELDRLKEQSLGIIICKLNNSETLSFFVIAFSAVGRSVVYANEE